MVPAHNSRNLVRIESIQWTVATIGEWTRELAQEMSETAANRTCQDSDSFYSPESLNVVEGWFKWKQNSAGVLVISDLTLRIHNIKVFYTLLQSLVECTTTHEWKFNHQEGIQPYVIKYDFVRKRKILIITQFAKKTLFNNGGSQLNFQFRSS